MTALAGPVPLTTAPPDTDSDVRVDQRWDEDLSTGQPQVAHIVRTDPGQSAVAKVTEARVFGYPVEALCGERFVPQRDPKRLPVCTPCKEIYDTYRAVGGNLPDTPGAG